MRCLHVVDALDATPSAQALLSLLRIRAGAPGLDADVHDVLALHGGRLEDAFDVWARRVIVADGGLDLAAAIHSGGYDIVHALDEAAGQRVAPIVVGTSAAALVYSGPALAGPGRERETSAGRSAEEGLVAASDLVVLAARPGVPGGREVEMDGRAARVDLSWALLAIGDQVADAPETASHAEFVLREWLGLLSRTVPASAA